MYCNHCGAEISENAKFCPECGRSVEEREIHNSVVTTSHSQNAPVEEEASSVFAILAIVFSALGSLAGLVFIIIGLNVYKTPEKRKQCFIALWILIAWLVLSVVLGVVLGVIWVFIWFIYMAAFVALV